MWTRLIFDKEVRLARELAQAADEIALRYFSSDVRHMKTQVKTDGSPVTLADTEIESMIRRTIEKVFPQDAVLGEEEGEIGSSDRRWIVDPLDATANFARGIPIFATLIGFEVQGEIVLGIASAPAMSERFEAVRGNGSYRNGKQISVSSTTQLSQAQLCHTSLTSYEDRGLTEGLLRVARATKRQRGFGDYWGHLLVAQGSVEVMVEPVVNSWDLAALKIIVEEAGGRFSALDGSPRIDAGDALSTNGLLHDTVLGLLRSP